MEKVSFQVQGSANQPYNVEISRSGSRLQCKCDCPAGEKRTPCKHWKGVFEGEKQKYMGISPDELADLRTWITGTDVEYVWAEIKENERMQDALKREKSALFAKLKRVMWE